MGFKRKRSFTSLSPCSTASTSSNTPAHSLEVSSPTPFSGTWPYGDAEMDGVEFAFTSPMSDGRMAGFGACFRHGAASYDGDVHLGSRTRKRFRDDRPEESVVHESTISKLFLAQRPTYIPPSFPVVRPPSMSSTASARSQQASLHSFWSLPRRPASAINTTLGPDFSVIESGKKCEDCDAWIASEVGHGAMDGMEVDGEAAECLGCGRSVCALCSVTQIGIGRECLGCKTRPSRWNAGIK